MCIAKARFSPSKRINLSVSVKNTTNYICDIMFSKHFLIIYDT